MCISLGEGNKASGFPKATHTPPHNKNNPLCNPATFPLLGPRGGGGGKRNPVRWGVRGIEELNPVPVHGMVPGGGRNSDLHWIGPRGSWSPPLWGGSMVQKPGWMGDGDKPVLDTQARMI